MDLHPRVVARTKSDRFATQLGLTFSIQNRHVIGGQPRLRLDADEKRRSPSRGYALTRKILALEAKGESSLLKTFPHCNPLYSLGSISRLVRIRRSQNIAEKFRRRGQSILPFKKEQRTKRNSILSRQLYLPIAERLARRVHGTNTRDAASRDDGSVWR